MMLEACATVKISYFTAAFISFYFTCACNLITEIHLYAQS